MDSKPVPISLLDANRVRFGCLMGRANAMICGSEIRSPEGMSVAGEGTNSGVGIVRAKFSQVRYSNLCSLGAARASLWRNFPSSGFVSLDVSVTGVELGGDLRPYWSARVLV